MYAAALSVISETACCLVCEEIMLLSHFRLGNMSLFRKKILPILNFGIYGRYSTWKELKKFVNKLLLIFPWRDRSSIIPSDHWKTFQRK